MWDDVTYDTNALIYESAINGKNVGKANSQKKNDKAGLTAGQYDKLAAQTTPAVVISFSGALDNQTAADVNDASSFELRPVTGPEKSGGATSNALHYVLKKYKNNLDDLTYSKLLIDMGHLLKERKYSQIPSLSTSQQTNLVKKKFELNNPLGKSSPGGGRKRALVIGINYYGTPMELGGCLNDAKMHLRWLKESGWPVDNPDNVRIITDLKAGDDSFDEFSKVKHLAPTGENILEGMRWLVDKSRSGDSLFISYSGHGSQLPEIPDEKGIYHEDDHMDETMVPLDYKTKGQIRDDTIYKLLVPTLGKGVQLLCFFDCCHSGSICDLPYTFTADTVNMAKLEDIEHKKEQGDQSAGEEQILMQANPNFNFDFAKKLMKQVLDGGFEGLPEVFNTLFVGDEAHLRWLKCQQCCYGMCFGGEANLYERRGEKRARLEKEKQEKEMKEKNGGKTPTAPDSGNNNGVAQPLVAPAADTS